MVSINMQNIALGAIGALTYMYGKKLGPLKGIAPIAGIGALALAGADALGFYKIDQVKAMIPGLNSMYATNVIPYQPSAANFGWVRPDQ